MHFCPCVVLIQGQLKVNREDKMRNLVFILIISTIYSIVDPYLATKPDWVILGKSKVIKLVYYLGLSEENLWKGKTPRVLYHLIASNQRTLIWLWKISFVSSNCQWPMANDKHKHKKRKVKDAFNRDILVNFELVLR